MAPHKPITYAGPTVAQPEQLSTALQSAKPDWSARELAVAQDKLNKIGIDSLDELFTALSEGLNTKIRSAGLKTFGSETILELKKVVNSRYVQMKLEETRTQKQKALEDCNYLEAAAHHLRLLELQSEAQPGEEENTAEKTAEKKRLLEDELTKVRAAKKAAAKAEDYVGAEQLKKREESLVAKVDALREPRARLQAQQKVLKKKLAYVSDEIAAALQAEEYEVAHAASERKEQLTEQLESLQEELGNCEEDAAAVASEPELEERPAAAAQVQPAVPQPAVPPSRVPQAAVPQAAVPQATEPPTAAAPQQGRQATRALPAAEEAASTPTANGADGQHAGAGGKEADELPEQRQVVVANGARQGTTTASLPPREESDVQEVLKVLDLDMDSDDEDAAPADNAAVQVVAEEKEAEQAPEQAPEVAPVQEEKKEEVAEVAAQNDGLPQLEEDDEPSRDPSVVRWIVAGGQLGVPVYDKRSFTSATRERLSKDSILEQVELAGEWLNFRKLTGTGPESGWLMTKRGSSVLARRYEPEAERAAANTRAALDARGDEIQPPKEAEKEEPQIAAVAKEDTEKEPEPEAPAAAPAEQEPIEIDPAVREKAKIVGIDWCLDDLQDRGKAEDLVARAKKTNMTTSKRLIAQCQELGLACDEGMSRAELAVVVREGIVWEELSLAGLRRVCREQGFEVMGDHQREELLRLLKSGTWERVGVPVHRLPGPEAAQALLHQIKELEVLSEMDLSLQCAEHGIATSEDAALMRENLRRCFVWSQLSLTELRRECQSWGLEKSLEGLEETEDACLLEMQRLQLLDDLGQALGREDRWQARGVPIERLGRERADEVLAELDRLQNMSLASIKAEYRKQELETDPNCSGDVQALLDDLRMVMIWKHLPEEVWKDECLENDIIPSSNRKSMFPQLLKRSRDTRKWLAQGIPKSLFLDSDLAAEISKQLTDVEEKMTQDALREWYEEQMFCPWEKNITREELVNALKLVTLGEQLPKDEVAQRCEEKGIEAEGLEMDEMLDKLFENDRLEAWDKRGYQALRIRSFDMVSKIVAKFEEFQEMEPEELKSQCAEFGIFSEAATTTEDCLRGLKQQLVWEALPAEELKNECAGLGIQVELPEEDADEFRDGLLQQLRVQQVKRSLQDRGLPVGSIPPELVMGLAGEFQRLAAMSLQELKDLRDELIPLPGDASKDELLSCFQDWTFLQNMPFEDLLREGRQAGVPTEGFELPDASTLSAEEAASIEEEIKVRLQARVFLRRRFRAARGAEEQLPQLLQSPTAAVLPGGNIEARQLPQVWKYIQQMKDPFMAEVVCSVPSMEVPPDSKLPAKAQKWEAIDAALHLLSGGVFDPNSCARSSKQYTPEEEKRLVSVICPTNSSRKIWHNLFYECFQAQQYEPKELIIVDTGNAPSHMFQEIAKDDPRVVYNFFPVTDTKDPRAETKKSATWSLGLKRNVACRIARGSVIAQFDDDDLYFPGYLDWFVPRVLDAAGDRDGSPGPALAKLSQWHLFDLHNMAFHHMDPRSRQCMPLREQPAALYGWGFSYVFTRAAWEAAPFPDVHFAEDAGFVEGLLAQGIPVSLVERPDDRTIVAHTVHPSSTTGGEVSVGQKGCNNPVEAPREFEGFFQKLAKQVLTKAKSRNLFGQTPGSSRAGPQAGQPAGRRGQGDE